MFKVTDENRAEFRMRMRALSMRYRKIAEDFEVLADNGRPTEGEMAAAPWVSGWRVGIRIDPSLIGIVNSHPLLGARRLVTTSWLVALDRSAGWARTESRIYRLGEPSSKAIGEGLF